MDAATFNSRSSSRCMIFILFLSVWEQGHSLGGALALITSLEAAVRFSVKEKKSPVTCITLGNPKAGGQTFRRVVQSLEGRGYLRVLGVHRHDDLVPLIPVWLCSCTIVKTFCHVGIQMKLKGDSMYTIKYLGLEKNTFWREMKKWRHLRLILPCMHKIKTRHFYKSYLDDLVARKNALETVTLNEYYEFEVFGAELSYS